MSMEELIDVYDENRVYTGLTVPRKTKLNPGQYMLYAIAIIENQEGKILITRRALNKKWAPGSWEIPGGGAHEGETTTDTVCREAFEETGIKVQPENTEVLYSYRNDDPKGDNYFNDIFLCKADFTLADVHTQAEEVIDVRLATLDEIKELHETDGFLHFERMMKALENRDMKKQAVNPYLPSWEYVPDGEPYVFDGRVYVYGSHDLYNGQAFCLGDYITYSAPIDDLGNWRYEGVIYPRMADPINDGRAVLYAPDVTIGPDGRYYLYYVLDKVSIVSVCVSASPAGPFEFYGYVHYADGTRLGEREGDEPQFDPGVITEDGKTYLYTGFCGFGDKSRTGSFCTVLDSDMLTIIQDPKLVVPGSCYSAGTEFEGHAFFEASSIRKRNGIYYFIYSSQVMHELCYATSDRPDAGFKYGGVIVSNCDVGIDSYKPVDMLTATPGNNHGSIVQIGEDWYIFYHRQTNGTWFSRQGCAEKIYFEEDGSIRQVEITSCGLNGGPLVGRGEYATYIACNIFNVDSPMSRFGNPNAARIIMDGRDGDEELGYVYNVKKGDVIGFKYFDCKGITKVRVTTRGYAYGYFEVRTKWDGEVLGTIKLDAANFWETKEADIAIPDGVNALYFTYCDGGSCSFKSFELV